MWCGVIMVSSLVAWLWDVTSVVWYDNGVFSCSMALGCYLCGVIMVSSLVAWLWDVTCVVWDDNGVFSCSMALGCHLCGVG